MTEISDRTINIDDLRGRPGDSEFLGDAVLDVLQDAEGRPQKVEPTALIFHGDVAAWITPPEDAQPADDAEPVPAHQHSWSILDAQEVPPIMAFTTKPVLRTAVLARCTNCGEPVSWLLNGTWTLEALRETEVLYGQGMTGA